MYACTCFQTAANLITFVESVLECLTEWSSTAPPISIWLWSKKKKKKKIPSNDFDTNAFSASVVLRVEKQGATCKKIIHLSPMERLSVEFSMEKSFNFWGFGSKHLTWRYIVKIEKPKRKKIWKHKKCCKKSEKKKKKKKPSKRILVEMQTLSNCLFC